ncbi:MAG: type pilus assembly ATPase PilB, type pilus assembly protein PilB [Candidatus Parcubacteria bacterium]|jgi:type IV pilus assembly protein PilB
MVPQFDEEKQIKKLDELRRGEEESLARILSEKYGVAYADLTLLPVDMDALRIVKEDEARAANAAVFNMQDKKNISVAVLSPQNEKAKEFIENLKKRGYITHVFMVSKQSLIKIWDRYKDLSFSFETKGGALDISNDQILTFLKDVKNLADVQKLVEETLAMKKAYRVSRIVEIILAGALSTGASDIHIEPEEAYVQLRYRLDGVLTEVSKFDTETFRLLLSRIKLLSGLKLNVKDSAQDGRLSIKVGEDDIEIRVSMLPGAYSESVVLRVLNPKSIAVPLESLGIHPRLLKVLEKAIEKPNGMILTTGPTGSGKTTTLYAFMRKIHNPGIKIITIENPIEYHLPGIVQTQTDEDKGYTFLEGLRSSLRQDPDVIMVGEIRDNETAEIAINAALTGHLVFSTLHTNNAAGAFPRLIDLGVNSKVITSAITVSIAQRLLRKLCDSCKEKIAVEGRNKEIVDHILSHIQDKTYLQDVALDSMWKSVGCEKCNFTGYKGRIGIYEAILTDENIETVVNQNPSEREIRKAAEPQQLLTMAQDGVIKILQGVTSVDELGRVIDLESAE